MNHWQGYANRWGHIEPPLRPTPAVVEAILDSASACPAPPLCATDQAHPGATLPSPLAGQTHAHAGANAGPTQGATTYPAPGGAARRPDEAMPQQPPAGPTLVLGVTPELTRALRNLVAVDRSQAMIARLWGGDSDAREALCADWLEMAPRRAPFVAAIGDGSLNVVAYPEQLEHLLRHLGALLIPGGRLAFRVFTRPERPIELSDLLALTSGPAMVNFHAFKWMLAMHLAAQGGGGVAVTEILRTFERHWPDRDLLAATTGWHRQAIDTIDVYRNADDRYGFPTRQEMLGRLPDCFRDAHYIETTGYDLAERCPILTCQRR